MPVVVSVTPERNEISVNQDAIVTVTYSKKMDTMKTSNEFTLSSDSGSVKGFFMWDAGDTVMVFRPAEPLERATRYTIRISGDSEDYEGNDLKEEFVSSFYTGGDDIIPDVVSYTPDANSIGNDVNTHVIIVFSESMDPGTVYSGISISPATEGYFEWNADNTIAMFRPLYGFNYGVSYTVSVSTSMKDAAGNKLADEESFIFTVGDDFTPPGITVYQNNTVPLYFDQDQQVDGAEKDNSITIDFSEVVVTDLITDAISITPAAKYYISTSTVNSGGVNITRAVINFTENLQSETVYTLRIGSSITDLQQNNLPDDYRYVFITDGPESICPRVTAIGDDAVASWSMNDVVTLYLNNVSDNYYENIRIDFSGVIDPLSLDITINMVAGNSGNVPYIVNVDWMNAFTRLSFGLYEVGTGHTYRIRIKGGPGGLRDQYGNYMKEDFEQIVKFTL
jgi:hypothetical protein